MVTDKQHYWEKLGFFGGHEFLDFINTYDDLGKTRDLDAIESWDILLRWAQQAAVVNNHELQSLTELNASKAAQLELQKLHELRELGWCIFSCIAANKPVLPEHLTTLSDHIQWAFSQSSLTSTKKHYQWDTAYASSGITLIRIRLLLSVNQLLSDSDLSKIKECGSCTALFLNKGRGVGRKWCRMQTCGNRAKINKFRSAK